MKSNELRKFIRQRLRDSMERGINDAQCLITGAGERVSSKDKANDSTVKS